MTYYEIKLTAPTGRTMTISPAEDSDLCLLEDGMEGFAATEMLVETEPYADGTGGHPVTRRFGERYMTVTAEIRRDPDTLRRDICAIMDPRCSLRMEVTMAGGVARTIDVIPCGTPEFRQANFFTPVEVTLPFLAPDPFYRAKDESRIIFWQSIPMLTFPMNFMAGAGTIAGYYRTTNSADVTNPGDGECGFTATLTASGGTVTDPVVLCGDKFIRLRCTLADGDTAVIDTRPRHKNVQINGVRQFTFDRNSDFFLLSPGVNRVTVDAADGTEYLAAEMSYIPLYYGI